MAAFSADPYRLGHASPIGPELAEIGYHDQPVEHRDAKQGDKSHRRWNRQIFSRSPERDDPAHHGERNVDKDEHGRSEEHTSELQSLMRISYAVFCLKKTKTIQPQRPRLNTQTTTNHQHQHINPT